MLGDLGEDQASTLRRTINQLDLVAAGAELGRWVYGGGKVLPGLIDRRGQEAKILNSRG